MAKLTKRQKLIQEKVDRERLYPVNEAFGVLKDCASVKFKESVEVSVNLGVDPRKSDQVVRGATVLPNGTGKQVRVAVFAQGAAADAAPVVGARRRGRGRDPRRARLRPQRRDPRAGGAAGRS